ncbi:MAG: tyrosine--tRNA ligase [Chlamydiota bacterium]|nr:tyrosine--tRNA ligase [Chlamydiota bacterium]
MNSIVNSLKKRGLIHSTTGEKVASILQKPTKIYLGIDPTADSLHLGHWAGIMFLSWFAREGHEPYVLIGGGTAKIGDPSGKSKERPLLDSDLITKYAESISRQCSRYLGKKAYYVNNNNWLGEYPLIDFLRDVGKEFRMGNMLSKESVKKRIQSDEGMSFTEFTYQAMQAYDFYYLRAEHGVMIQVGGSDQWGNITAGTDLIRKRGIGEAGGITFPLLLKGDGSKFGKSEGGTLWLDRQKTSPYQLYQYLVSVEDQEVGKLLRWLTFLPLEEIEAIEGEIASGEFTPHDAQKKLAGEVLTLVHGREGRELAMKITEILSPGGGQVILNEQLLETLADEIPGGIYERSEVIGLGLTQFLKNTGIVTSKQEGLRLVKNGGISLNNRKVTDPHMSLTNKELYKGRHLLVGKGKKEKWLIQIKEKN